MQIIDQHNPNPVAPLEVVRLARAAEILDMSRATLTREIRRGRLRTIGKGHLRRVALEDIRAYQEANRHAETETTR